MSANPCLITGCDLVDQAHNRWCHGDLFRWGDSWVFNACLNADNFLGPNWNTSNEGRKPHPNHILVKSYWQRRGVFVIALTDGYLSASAADYILGKD